MKQSKLIARHLLSTAGFAQPAGFGGAKQCFAKPLPRPLAGAGRLVGSLRSIIAARSPSRFALVFLLSALCSSMALAGVKIEHWTAPTGAKVYFCLLYTS